MMKSQLVLQRMLLQNIDDEESARIAADATLQSNIDAEEVARVAADGTLQSNIDAEEQPVLIWMGFYLLKQQEMLPI